MSGRVHYLRRPAATVISHPEPMPFGDVKMVAVFAFGVCVGLVLCVGLAYFGRWLLS